MKIKTIKAWAVVKNGAVKDVSYRGKVIKLKVYDDERMACWNSDSPECKVIPINITINRAKLK